MTETTRPGPTRVTVLRCTGCPWLRSRQPYFCEHPEDNQKVIGRGIKDDSETPDWCPLPAPPDPRDALLREVAGTWTAFEHALREAIGNTNYNVIAERIEAAIGDKEESNRE